MGQSADRWTISVVISTNVNSAFHPSEVVKSNTGPGWVKASHVHLYRVAGKTVITYGRWRSILLRWVFRNNISKGIALRLWLLSTTKRNGGWLYIMTARAQYLCSLINQQKWHWLIIVPRCWLNLYGRIKRRLCDISVTLPETRIDVSVTGGCGEVGGGDQRSVAKSVIGCCQVTCRPIRCRQLLCVG